MGYSEVYCSDCKKVLGRYNSKYYTDDHIWAVTQASHANHVKDGHSLTLRRIQ